MTLQELKNLIISATPTRSISNTRLLGVDLSAGAGQNVVVIRGTDLGSGGNLDAKEDKINKGVADGYAELDSTGRVPTAQLPSFVDDVVEYDNLAAFPATGESSKIYVALDTNKVYRWSGTVYVEISATLILGELSTTAYRGDRGKTAYDHSQETGNAHSMNLNDLDDINASLPDDNQVLTWDSTTSKWIAQTIEATGTNSINGLSDGISGASSVILGVNSAPTDDGNSSSVVVGINNAPNGVTGSYLIGKDIASNPTFPFSMDSTIAIGFQTMLNSIASYQIVVGGEALQNLESNINYIYNIIIGHNGAKLLTQGTENVGIGGYVFANKLTGSENTAIGTYAMQNGTTGSKNVAIGKMALQKVTDDYNVAVGYQALQDLTSGEINTAVGYNSAANTTTGIQNTAVGGSALNQNLTGHGNTAIGHMSLVANNATSNTAVGASSLGSITTGGENTAIGLESGHYAVVGSNRTSSESVYIGRSCKAKVDGGVNEIVIGHSAIGNGTNTATIGDDRVTDLYSNENGDATIHVGKIQLAALNTAPSSASDTGTVGEIRFDDTYMYVCVATDTWKRSLLETW